MAHTPGPWTVQGCKGLIVNDSMGRTVSCHPGDTVEESQANAHLIAAAPDLLEALKIIRVQFGDYRYGQGAAKFHACNIADQAIAKAEGSA